MKIHFGLLTLISLFSFTSCLKDKTVPVDECATFISYTSDIRPIIESSCKTGLGGGTGCHDAWIDEHENITPYMTSSIWPNSVLVEKTMPLIPNDFGIDSLTEDEIQIMKCWIDQGYPEN